VARSQPQAIRIVLGNSTSISKTSSLVNSQADPMFQVRHGRTKAEYEHYTEHPKHKTDRIE